MSNLPVALQKILNCLLHLFRTLDFNLMHASLVHDTRKCLTKRLQIQECSLRTSLTRISVTSLLPFPFKVCSERTIDFHLMLTKMLTLEIFFLPIRRKSAARAICFLLIRSISLQAIFTVIPVQHYMIYVFCL